MHSTHNSIALCFKAAPKMVGFASSFSVLESLIKSVAIKCNPHSRCLSFKSKSWLFFSLIKYNQSFRRATFCGNLSKWQRKRKKNRSFSDIDNGEINSHWILRETWNSCRSIKYRPTFIYTASNAVLWLLYIFCCVQYLLCYNRCPITGWIGNFREYCRYGMIDQHAAGWMHWRFGKV